MTRFAIITAAALATLPLAAPSVAQTSAVAFAIERFNQDYDSLSDIRRAPSGDSRVVVSTRSGGLLAQAFGRFNEDFDSRADIRGVFGATLYRNRPAHGARIFDTIRAESREDE